MAREKLSNQRCGPDREPSAALLRALTWHGRSFECQYNIQDAELCMAWDTRYTGQPVSYAACHCEYSCLPQFHLSAERSEMRCLSPAQCAPVQCAGARVTVCHHRPGPGTGEQWSVGAGTPGGTHRTPHTCTWHLYLHLHLTQGPPPRWSAASAGSWPWPPSPASGPGSRRTRGTARWSSRGTSRGTSTLQVSGLLFIVPVPTPSVRR